MGADSPVTFEEIHRECVSRSDSSSDKLCEHTAKLLSAHDMLGYRELVLELDFDSSSSLENASWHNEYKSEGNAEENNADVSLHRLAA